MIFSGINLAVTDVFSENSPTIIIDAGHGDPDGGAVAIDGTHESDINLQIVLKMAELLKEKNVKCVLTRSDKNAIYSEGDSIHQKKISDIRNRVDLAKKYKNAVFISIHMNTFPSSEVSGTQVFYKSGNSYSEEIANEIQKVINDRLQPQNQKKIKTIPSNIYLFKNIPNECVLIECGFLTNPDDLTNLKNEQFQNKISSIISEVLIFKLFGG